MSSIADEAMAAARTPRFEDGSINLQELLRQLAESVVNEIMGAEADQLCGATGNSRNGYRERALVTCAGTLTLRIPKLRSGSFLPGDVLERCRRVDRAVVAAVAETRAAGTSTRKARRVAAAMGIERLPGDQVSAICASPGADAGELAARPLGAPGVPYLWIDATYVKRGREGRVASTAVAAAIGCDSDGWRHVLGIGVVDTESCDSWSAFLRGIRAGGVRGAGLVTSDAREGLRRAAEGEFQGAAWQRCVVRLMRGCARAAGSRGLAKRVCRIVAPVFRLKEAGAVRAACHIAADMLEGCCPEAARILEEAEPDALAYLDFPASHWKRLRTNNLQERTNREIKRRSRVARLFPPAASPGRLAGAVMCGRDDAWSASRYFSEKAMAELCEEGPAGAALVGELERRELILRYSFHCGLRSLESFSWSKEIPGRRPRLFQGVLTPQFATRSVDAGGKLFTGSLFRQQLKKVSVRLTLHEKEGYAARNHAVYNEHVNNISPIWESRTLYEIGEIYSTGTPANACCVLDTKPLMGGMLLVTFSSGERKLFNTPRFKVPFLLFQG